MKSIGLDAALAAAAMVMAPAQSVLAQKVEITRLGSHDGEFCRFDRAMILEDPDGTRILCGLRAGPCG